MPIFYSLKIPNQLPGTRELRVVFALSAQRACKRGQRDSDKGKLLIMGYTFWSFHKSNFCRDTALLTHTTNLKFGFALKERENLNV
jgi:hypothetical protein